MIATLQNMPSMRVHVPQNRRGVLRISDYLRSKAASELKEALKGVSCKAIENADIPTLTVTFVSRSKSADSCNPFYRCAAVFVLMKRLGMSKARAQRLIDWQQDVADQIWGDEVPEFDSAMEEESDLDSADEPLQTRALLGSAEALRKWIDAKRRSRAHDVVAIRAAECRLAELEASA